MALGRGKKRYSIDSETFELNEQLKSQDEQLESIKNAEKKYELDGNIDSLIKFWEDIWNNGGLLFRGMLGRRDLHGLSVFQIYILSKSDTMTPCLS